MYVCMYVCMFYLNPCLLLNYNQLPDKGEKIQLYFNKYRRVDASDPRSSSLVQSRAACRLEGLYLPLDCL